MSDRIQASTQSGATITGPFISESLNDGAENRYKAVGTRAQCEVQRQIWRALRASRLELEPNGDGQWQLNASFAGLPSDEGGAEAEVPTNLHELETRAETGDYRSFSILMVESKARYIATRAFEFYNKDGYADGSDYLRQQGAATTEAWRLMSPRSRAEADIARQLALDGLSAQVEVAQALFNRLLAGGGELIYKFSSVYRRTITAASSSQVRAAYTGVGKIWKSDEVESFEGIPTSEWFGLPSDYWLKLPPRVTAAAGGKTDIEYTYQGGFFLASAFFYEAYGSATLLDAPAP